MDRRLDGIYNFATAQAAARRQLPKALFDFIDGGADDEVTLRDNHAAYQRVTFRPRVGLSIPHPGLDTTVLGCRLSMPLVLAPCGGSRLVYPDGDRALVRAAGTAGTAAVMSTASSTAPEDVAAAASGPVWFQLYYRGSREANASLVGRVQEAGFQALFVTLDMPLRGNQERVRSNERVVPPRPTLANAVRYGPQLAARPRWTLGYVRDGLPSGVAPAPGSASPAAGHRGPPWRQGAADMLSSFPGGRGLSALVGGPGRSSSTGGPADPAGPAVPAGPRAALANVTWDDVAFIRECWTGPLVVKGILTGDDARRALDCGADAIAVSNHGGRQLDSAPATLSALPEVRAAVGPSVEVLIDGGIRRGSDVLKALALGADAAMIGRPYLYGLAVGGEAGVGRMLELFRDDLIRNLRLLGRESVGEIDRTVIDASRLGASG